MDFGNTSRHGMKVFALWDSETRYCIKYDIYTGGHYHYWKRLPFAILQHPFLSEKKISKLIMQENFGTFYSSWNHQMRLKMVHFIKLGLVNLKCVTYTSVLKKIITVNQEVHNNT